MQAYDTGDSGFFALPEGLGTESSDTHFLHHASVHGATAVGSLTCAGLRYKGSFFVVVNLKD